MQWFVVPALAQNARTGHPTIYLLQKEVNKGWATRPMERWRKRWTVPEWRAFLAAAESSDDLSTLRQFTHTGRPLGSPEFVAALEEQTRRRLTARKGGRSKEPVPDSNQSTLNFVA